MRFTVTDDLSGQRIDMLLSRRFTYRSRTGWQAEIRGGNIRINGTPGRVPHRKVVPGDVIEYNAAGHREPPVDENYSILYRDDHMVVAAKPGDLPTHPSGAYFNNTLTRLIERDTGETLTPLHRLDRETSGIIILARHGRHVHPLRRSLLNGKKEYTAIVGGVPPWNSIMVHTPLGPDITSVVRKKRVACDGAPESARTEFLLLRAYSRHSLVRAILHTGRQHQVRAHLLHLGHPVIGDKLYGGDERWFLHFIEKGLTPALVQALGMERCALHAEYCTLVHPFTGEKMTFHAPMPRDMNEYIRNVEDVNG